MITILYNSKIIFKWIHRTLNEAQSCDQAGVRLKLSFEDRVFIVAVLVEKSNEFGRPRWMATLDFNKAFDTMKHDSIWVALRDQGVARTYILLLQRLYEGQRAVAETHTHERSKALGIFE